MSGPGARRPRAVVRPLPTAGALADVALLFVALALAATASAAAPDVEAACSFVVDLTATPSGGSAPLLVHLNASVSSGTPSTYDWEFGDGSVWNASGPGAADPIHRYSQPGTYPVNVSVTEGSCVGPGRVTVDVGPSALAATVLPTTVSGAAPLTVSFNLVVTGGSGTYVSAFWTFGDGGVGTGFPVNYTFERPGAFSVVANVTDSGGHWALARSTVHVADAPAPASGSWLTGPTGTLALAAIAAAAAVLVGLAMYRGTRSSHAGPPPGAEMGSPASPADAGSPPSLSADASAAATPAAASATVGVGVDTVTTARGSPRAAGDAEPPDGSRRGRVQLTQRVILHIGAQGRIGVDAIGPASLTQAGMAAALGVGQNSLTNVLRRLVAAGVLTQDLRHVSGQPRRLRVYRLTEKGEALLRDLRATSGFAAGRGRP